MVASGEHRAMGDTWDLHLVGLHDANISGIPGRAPSTEASDETLRPASEGFSATLQ